MSYTAGGTGPQTGGNPNSPGGDGGGTPGGDGGTGGHDGGGGNNYSGGTGPQTGGNPNSPGGDGGGTPGGIGSGGGKGGGGNNYSSGGYGPQNGTNPNGFGGDNGGGNSGGLGFGGGQQGGNNYSAGGYGPQNGTNPNGLGGDNGGGNSGGLGFGGGQQGGGINKTNSYSAGGYGPQNGTNPDGLGGDNGGGGPTTSPDHESAIDRLFDSIYDVLGPAPAPPAKPTGITPLDPMDRFPGGYGPQNTNPDQTGGDNGNTFGSGEHVDGNFGPNHAPTPQKDPTQIGADLVSRAWADEYGSNSNTDTDPDTDRRPIVLDLDDNGIQITQEQDSHQFVDTVGDGYKHQTAWAGAGDGVLFYDFDGDGQLTQSKEVIFTAWDPTAKSDMQALKDVFDSNHDGKFDASDAHWADFKVMVTNADGTYSVKTLAELGIKSIDLTEDGTKIKLPDGSSIDGQTTYTKTDNSTHTVATVSFATDANGYAVQTSKSVDGGGVTTIDIKTINHDGSLHGEKIVITSADGLTQTTKSDLNGDGVIDNILTDVSSTVSGVKTETLTNTTGAGSLVDKTTIVTSTTAGVKTVATSRDLIGGGWTNQTEALVTNADKSSSDTLTNVAFNGATINQSKTVISADGLSRTTSVDIDGNGTFDGSVSDVTVVNGTTGARTETIQHLAADGTLQYQSVTVTDKSGQNKTTTINADGDEYDDYTDVVATTTDKSGNTVITETLSNIWSDHEAISTTITTESQNGLWTKTERDLDGDGLIDRTTEDTTVVGGDGTRTETVTIKAHDGSLLSSIVTTKHADGVSREIDSDLNGDGHNDVVEVISIDGTGVTTDTTTYYGIDGTKLASSSRSTTTDGLTVTVSHDHTGTGTIDAINSDQTIKNANGSSTETVSAKSGNGTLLGQTIIDISADGLTVKTQRDINGDGVADNVHLSVTTLNGDGSKQIVVTDKSANGTLLDQQTTQISTDRRTTTITSDFHGLGKTDRVETIAVQANGSIVDTRTNYAENGTGTGLGTLINSQVTTTSANGLSKTVQSDYNGDGTFDVTLSDVTAYNADGTVTETASVTHGTTLASKSVATTDAHGHQTTTKVDLNGDGTVDNTRIAATNVPYVGDTNYVGMTAYDQWADGTTHDSMAIYTTKDGLTTYTGYSVGNAGVSKMIGTVDYKVLNADGSTTETVYVDGDTDLSVIPGQFNPDTDWHVSEEIINISKDGLTKTIHREAQFGSSPYFTDETIAVQANGDTIDTKTFNLPYGDGTSHEVGATRITTSGNGLSVKTEHDANGDGTYDITKTDVTTIAANGTRTETIDLKIGATLASEHVHSVTGNGLTVTDKYDENGDGTFDLTTVVAATVNADGSQVVTTTDTAANGSQIGSVTVTTSADDKTVTTNYVDPATGVTVTSHSSVIAADGSATDTVYAGVTTTNPGYLATHYVSANGLSHVDTYYDGHDTTKGALSTLYDKIADNLVYNADGTTTETLTQSGLISGTITTTTAANDYSKTVAMTLFGAGAANVTENYTTTIAPNLITQTITDVVSGVTKDKSTTAWTNNGLTRTVGLDINNDGSNDITDTMTIDVWDAAVDETITNYNYTTKAVTGHTWYEIGDGAAQWSVLQDTNGDNNSDIGETLFLNSDGSVSVSSSSSAGTNLPSYNQSRKSSLQTDGTTLITEYEQIGAGLGGYTFGFGNVQEARSTVISADGLHKTTTLDVNGDGTTDRTIKTDTTIQADGSTLVDTVGTYTGGAKQFEEKVVTSHDGLSVVTSSDVDGNGIFERVSTIARSPDSRTTNQVIYYDNKTGAVITETDVVNKEDGLSSVITSGASGKVVDSINAYAGANGSYQFTRSVSGAQVGYAMHAVDANLVDTWSWNISNKTSWATTTSDTVVATSGSVVIDLASEQKVEAAAAAIYGAAYGREMTTDEHEMLAMYVANGALNTATLTTNVLASSEFTFRYGTLDNAAFVTQIFKNAFGFTPSADVLAMYTSQLVAATMTKAQVLASIAQGAATLGTANDVTSLFTHTMNQTGDQASPNLNSLAGLNSANAAYYFMMDQLGGPNLALTDIEKAALALAVSLDPINNDANGQYANIQALIQNGNAPGGIFGEPAIPTTVTSTPIISTSGTATVTQNNGYVNMAASSKTTLSGNNNMVAQNASSTLTVTGAGNMVEVTGTAVTTNMSASTVVIENSAVDALNGNNNQVMMQTSGKVTVTGTGTSMDVIGATNTATMSNGHVSLQKSAGLTLTGSNDEIYVGTSGKISATGANNLIHAVGATTTVTVSGAGNTVVVGAGAGSGSAITIGGGANTVDYSMLQNTDTITVTGSTFADTIMAGSAFGLHDTIAAGAGTDTLVVVESVASGSYFANVTGIDVLQISTPTSWSGEFNVVISDALVSKSDAKTLTVNALYGQSNYGTTADGSAVLAADKLIMNGGASGDILIGGAGNDALDGGGSLTWQNSRGDLLKGGAGVNIYKVNQNYGFTEIDNSFSGGTAAHGELDFGAGLTAQNLWLKQVGNNLEIDMLGSTDHTTIDGWFGTNVSAKLSEIKLSDGSMIDASVSTLVSAMAAYQTANPGFDPTAATTMPTDTTLQNTITASWHH